MSSIIFTTSVIAGGIGSPSPIRPGESGVSYPRYIAGEWNVPPEDCGGIPGFYALLEAVADPNHPNHAEAEGPS
jgi:Plasmid pRiA4b ORF-3-like protein